MFSFGVSLITFQDNDVEVLEKSPAKDSLQKRVQKRAGKQYHNKNTTPRTKEKAAKLHHRLSMGDKSLETFIDNIEEEDENSVSQEAMDMTMDYMGHAE